MAVEKLSILVKKLRESRNLTIMQLAEKASLGNGTIGDIESGRSKGSRKSLNKIAEALDLTIEERNRLDNAFMGRDITSMSDSRVENLSKRDKSQYDRTIDEASLFFNDENVSEEDKQKLLMAMNELFFMSKQMNKEKYSKKPNKDKK